MTDGKLIAAGLFAIAFSLSAVAWAIHDHAQRHARYTFLPPYRFDTLKGGIEECQGSTGLGMCERWDTRLDPE